MNRIVNPLVPISGLVGEDGKQVEPTEKDVNDFFDLTKEPDERPSGYFAYNFAGKNYDGSGQVGVPPVLGPTYAQSAYKTRVLVVVFDTDEYETELKKYQGSSKELSDQRISQIWFSDKQEASQKT